MLGRDAVYVWASGIPEARTKAYQKLKATGVRVLKSELMPTRTGLTRPGGYDFSGSAADGYTEEVGKTSYRYAVRYG